MQDRSDTIAFRYGAIIGVIGGGLCLLIVILITAFKNDPGVLLVGCVGFVAGIALLFEAGHITAMQTGTVSSGALAGATAGFLMGMGLSILSLIQQIQSGKLQSLHSLGPSGFTLGIVVALLFNGALVAGLGAGLGALGSLVGQAGFRQGRTRDVALPDGHPDIR